MSAASGVAVCAAVLGLGCGLSAGSAGGAPAGTDDAAPLGVRTVAPSEPPPERIGEGLIGRAPAAGTYAMKMSDLPASSCSQSWAGWSSQARLTLRLDPRGRAAACRAREARHTDPDTSFVMSHRHAYGGTWRREGAWVVVDLEPASSAECPEQAERAHEDVQAWQLRCIAIEPEGAHAVVRDPVLGCRFAEGGRTDTLGYVVAPGVIDVEPWIVLGREPGVQIDQTDDLGLAATRITPIQASDAQAARTVGRTTSYAAAVQARIPRRRVRSPS